MLKNWRSWVLIALFLGPYLAFIGLGMLWLKQKGWTWVCVAGLISIACGVVFTLLMSRWTKAKGSFLPPIDWETPGTFSEFDRKAWELVEAESDRGEALEMATLTNLDTYVDTGKRLASRLAAHYHPLSADPIDRVPVIEILTALELAAEDLSQLCRQVPGADLVTAGDWKRAVVAANYIQKASDIYTYLLPLFNPVTGLSRIASQHVMVKPAWKNMQQNVLRWFHRAFVNRLGMHLVELYSGRLVIGATHYRKLTRKIGGKVEVDPTSVDLVIAIAGSRDSGKSTLLKAIDAARAGETGGNFATLKRAKLVEVDSYTGHPEQESARDRSTRRHAVAKAVDADLLILVVDARSGVKDADTTFLDAWVRWYAENPGLSVPPAMAVLSHLDSIDVGNVVREAAIKVKVSEARGRLPAMITTIVPNPIESVLLPLSTLCLKAERGALIRHLHETSARSKAGRLFRQVGEQGRSLWQGIRERNKPRNAS